MLTTWLRVENSPTASSWTCYFYNKANVYYWKKINREKIEGIGRKKLHRNINKEEHPGILNKPDFQAKSLGRLMQCNNFKNISLDWWWQCQIPKWNHALIWKSSQLWTVSCNPSVIQACQSFIWQTWVLSCCFILFAALQLTVFHQSLADQNLLLSNDIPAVGGHDIWTLFYRKFLYIRDE